MVIVAVLVAEQVPFVTVQVAVMTAPPEDSPALGV